jgi:hypothetical protein
VSTPARGFWVACFLGIAAFAGAAAQDLPPPDANYLADVRRAARQFEAELRRVQDGVVARYEGRRERDLYRLGDAALAGVDRLQGALRPGVGRDRVYEAFGALDPPVHDLLKALPELGPDGQVLAGPADWLARADQELHAAVFRADTTEPRTREAVDRQAAALAREARDLARAARYALPEQGPGRSSVEDGLRQFADAAERFRRDAAEGFDRERLRRAYAGLADAWAGVSGPLSTLPRRDARDLWERARRVDDLLEGLHARLEVGGERRRFETFDLLALIAAGKQFEIAARHSGKCLDVDHGSREDGARVQQWQCLGVPNQRWQFLAVEQGWVRIVSVNSDKCLEVTDGSRANGARIRQWADTGEAYQHWALAAVGGGWYKITNRATGRCLDVGYASQDDGAYVHQWDYTGVPNQQWRLTPVD